MRVRLVAVAIVLAAGLLAVDTHAQGRAEGRGRGNDRGNAPDSGGPSVSVSVVFRDSDRATFRDYFVKNRIRPEALPPGIAKNVARGKPLPPGIAKKALPADLLAVAPRGPGITYVIVGPLVVAIRNGAVVDILDNIF